MKKYTATVIIDREFCFSVTSWLPSAFRCADDVVLRTGHGLGTDWALFSPSAGG